MTPVGRLAGLVRRARVRHRLRALFGAAESVSSPARFIAGEVAFLPLRPVALAFARVRGTNPGDAWRAVTRPLGGQIADHRLRVSGRPVSIRRGTSDVFTLYETHTGGSYLPPEPAAVALAAAGPAPRVLDLGANIGLFALYAFGRWPGAEIVSFEPDPANLPLLRRNAEANGDARWTIVPACAAITDGSVPFLSGHFAISRRPTNGETPSTAVPAVDVYPHLALADLVKMDIEGGEWPILFDDRFASLRAAAIVLEYHQWGCPSDDPAGAARQALERAGFTVGPVRQEEPGSGTLWAWRA